MTLTIQLPNHTTESFEPKSACPLADDTFENLIKADKGKRPYLLARSDNGVSWVDAKMLVSKVEKIHLFALFKLQFESVGTFPAQMAKDLFFFETPPVTFSEEKEVIDAFRFYYKGKEEASLCRICYENACNQEDPSGKLALMLGMALMTVKEAKKEVHAHLKRAVQKGNVVAACRLGLFHEQQGDQKKARKYLGKAWGLGSEEAKMPYAIMCRDGVGGNIDIATAKLIYFPLAERGDVTACYEYAELCKDQKEHAYPWYVKAAEADKPHPLAAFSAACILRERIVEDPERERELFAQAAANPNPTACFYLAEMFEKGIGGEKDLAEAKKYYELAANIGGHSKKELESKSPSFFAGSSPGASSKRKFLGQLFSMPRRVSSSEDFSMPGKLLPRSESTVSVDGSASSHSGRSRNHSTTSEDEGRSSSLSGRVRNCSTTTHDAADD